MEGTPEVGSHAQEERFREIEGRLTTVEEDGSSEDWHVIGDPGEPDFEAGFSNQGDALPAAFRKAGNVVYLRGKVTGPQGGNIVILPEGYRPEAGDFRAFAVAQLSNTDRTCLMNLDGSGYIYPEGDDAAAIWISLDAAVAL
jgi:hypothetical protein